MSDDGTALLVRGAEVLIAADAEPRRLDVLAEGGTISALEPQIEPAPGTEVLDGSGCLLVPGLVNCHLHSGDALLRGSFPNLPLELWLLRAYPVLGGPPLSDRLVYLRTLLVTIECLRSGTTCVLDDVVEPVPQSLDSLTAVFGAYADAGIRANCTGSVVDRTALGTLPGYRELVPKALRAEMEAAPVPSVEEYLELSAEAVSRLHRPERGRQYVVAPSGPQWCSDELLVACADFAAEHDLNLHLHVAETRLQMQAARELYGCSAVAHLDSLGALTPRTTIAHAIWLEPGDLELIAAAGAAIVHNPTSNQRLGSGIAAVSRFLDAGIPVGLGADNPSASDSLDMFEVMRAACLLGGLAGDDYRQWISPRQVLAAATAGGARCALLGQKIGSIAVGRQADLVLLDLDHPAFIPRNDLATQLVAGSPGSATRTVVVGGEIVLADGRSTKIDEEAVHTELASYLPSYRRGHAAAEASSRRFEPYVEAMLRRVGQPDAPRPAR